MGGTTEARLLAGRLAEDARVSVLLSLAGRTVVPVTMPAPVRSGGFGGVTGLVDFLKDRGTDILIDATHPFAVNISDNANKAAAIAGVPLITLCRPEWVRQRGDKWTEVTNTQSAIIALGEAPRRVFLTLGRQEAHVANAAPQHHYLVRSVEPIEPPLSVPGVDYLLDRGPFAVADDLALLRAHAIDVVVSKNSGGAASYSKIAAARALGIGVILVKRAQNSLGPSAETVDAVLDHVQDLIERGE